ncbi:starvation-inducible DNA-binding protein [Bacteriovorax stolpii]|nr:DNA starvation/stationary phase protection protein [Bacteriovorax stolpii]TDP51545.1 starvation-inducible DNA-binding protein [Bacteriovorax stolpii]
MKEQMTSIQNKTRTTDEANLAQPVMNQNAGEIQKFGTRFRVPLGLDDKVCEQSITNLNRILADTITLRDLYKKCHWQTSGVTFYQLHLLFDKHYNEQAELVDLMAERIQLLGGISVAMAKDVAEMAQIETPPSGREEVPAQISRLVDAHEAILKFVRKAARQAADSGDEGTNDLLVSNVIRTNELQTWFVSEHLVALSPVEGNLASYDKSFGYGGPAHSEKAAKAKH